MSLEIERQINKAIEARNELFAKQKDIVAQTNELLMKQLQITDPKRYEDLNRAAQQVAENLSKAEKEQQNLNKGADEANKKFSRTKALVGTVAGGIKKLSGLVLGLSGILTGAMIGAYKSLVNYAAQLYDRMMRVTEATEKIREKFGDISTGTGKDALTLGRNLSKVYSQAGVSLGFGWDRSINVINLALEVMNNMGDSVDIFRQMSKASQAEFAFFAKGMGLGADEMQGVMRAAQALGVDGADLIKEAAQAAGDFASVTGTTRKLVSQDVAKMVKDVAHFGGMTVRQMGAASARIRAMGMSITEVTGLAEKFDDFETAADSVSKLTQAFGVQLDTMQMMRENDPTKRLEMMRKAMFAAGRSAESMTRQELKLLGAQTNLTEEQARLAFSSKNRMMSERDLKKRLEEQKTPQERQVELLQQVAKEIENVVVKLSDMNIESKGFFGSFLKGISDGIFEFGPFQDVANAAGEAMKRLYRRGREFAELILDRYPAIEDAMRKIVEFLDSSTMDTFFTDLMTLLMDLADAVVPALKDAFNAAVPVLKDVGKFLWEKALKPGLAFIWENFWPWIAGGIGAFIGFKAVLKVVKMGFGKLASKFVKGAPTEEAARAAGGGLKGIIEAMANINAGIIGKAIIGAVAAGSFILVLGGFIAATAKLAGWILKGSFKEAAMAMPILGAVMAATVVMMPVAAGLGALMTGPQGLLIAALAAAGLATLGLFSVALVATFAPAIDKLANIKIPDPATFKIVVKTVVALMQMTIEFSGSIGKIAGSFKPGGLFRKKDFDGMAKSMGALTGLIDSIKSVAIDLIDKIAEIAVTLAGKEGTLDAIDTVANMIGAIAKMMTVLSPSMIQLEKAPKPKQADAIKQIMEAEVTRLHDVFSAMKIYLPNLIRVMIDSVKNLDMDPATLKTKSESLTALFDGISSLMRAMDAIGKSMEDLSQKGMGQGGYLSVLKRQIGMMSNVIGFISVQIAKSKLMENIDSLISRIKVESAKKFESVAESIGSVASSAGRIVGALSSFYGKYEKKSSGFVLGIIGIGSVVEQLTTSYKDFPTGDLAKAGKNMSKIADIMETDIKLSTDRLVENIAKMAQNMKTVIAEINKIDPVEVQAKMTDLAVAAAFGEETTTTIDTGKALLEVKVNVVMDGRRVARGLSRHGLAHTKRF